MKVGHCLFLSQSCICPLNLLEELTLDWQTNVLSQSSICHPNIALRLWWHGHWIATHLRKAKTEDLFHNQFLAELSKMLPFYFLAPVCRTQRLTAELVAWQMPHAVGSGGASRVQLFGMRDNQLPALQIIHAYVCVQEKDRQEHGWTGHAHCQFCPCTLLCASNFDLLQSCFVQALGKKGSRP